MLLKVGLTGGIGSGKTTVANVFITLGVPVFFADDVARKILNEDVILMQKIQDAFGVAVYENGFLNRKYIADIVFKDSHKLEQLNSLVHPATIAMAEQWMNQQTTPYAVKEAALLFEAGTASGLHYIIGVYAPQHLRIQRVIQRDNVSPEEVIARMNKQINEEIKMSLCDFVITNDEQELVIPQILAINRTLIKLTG